MGDPPGMEGGVPATDSSQRVCDYATYMELLQENAELHRSNRLLQAVAVVPNSSPSGDDERSRQWELLQTELKVSEAKLKDLEAILNGQDVDLTLVEEKRHLQHLNVGLSEKVAAIQAKEARTRGELQDSRDQAELLEFRVLELEDERDRVSKIYETPFLLPCVSVSLSLQLQRDKDLFSPSSPNMDSGCNTSCATEEDLLERYLDFRVRNFTNTNKANKNIKYIPPVQKEKVTDTKHKLQALVTTTPEAGDKSLLLQSVALLETLLSKIHTLQEENEDLKKVQRAQQDGEPPYGEVVLELESTRRRLEEAGREAEGLRAECGRRADRIAALEREGEARTEATAMQGKVEGVLQRQVTELRTKLDSSMEGRLAESEMCDEAVVKALRMENHLTEMESKVN